MSGDINGPYTFKKAMSLKEQHSDEPTMILKTVVDFDGKEINK